MRQHSCFVFWVQIPDVLRFFEVFFSPSRQTRGQYTKESDENFLPNALLPIILFSFHPDIRRYVVYQLNAAVNEDRKTDNSWLQVSKLFVKLTQRCKHYIQSTHLSPKTTGYFDDWAHNDESQDTAVSIVWLGYWLDNQEMLIRLPAHLTFLISKVSSPALNLSGLLLIVYVSLFPRH
jgi:hypothetical protein